MDVPLCLSSVFTATKAHTLTIPSTTEGHAWWTHQCSSTYLLLTNVHQNYYWLRIIMHYTDGTTEAQGQLCRIGAVRDM